MLLQPDYPSAVRMSASNSTRVSLRTPFIITQASWSEPAGSLAGWR